MLLVTAALVLGSGLLFPSEAAFFHRSFCSDRLKRRTKNEPRLAVPSCHGRR